MIVMTSNVRPGEDFYDITQNGLLTVQACPTCGSRSIYSKKPTKNIYDIPLSRLRCGYTMSTEDRQTATTNARSFRNDLKALNCELAELHSRIKQIESQRADIELAISYQTGLLAPIRSLPEEILVEILGYCSRGRVDVCSPRSDIWQLERVCKWWRDIIRSTQSIWTSIDVYLGSLTPYRAGVPLTAVERLVKQCIDLSGDSSLSIKFVEIGLPEHFKEVFNLFAQSSHRWKDMAFSLSMLNESPTLEYGLTRLQSLSLSGAYKGEAPLDSFQHAQQLQELRLFSVPRPFISIIIPWHQLRCFQAVFCDFRTGEFMEMLQHMPNLVEVSSKWSRGLVKNHAKLIRPINFRFLQSLEIEASPAEICTVLRLITTPILNHLYVLTHQQSSSGISPFSHISDTIVDMIHRSRTCYITTLSLSSVDANCVTRILEETPDVEHLILVYITNVEMFLDQLSRSESLIPRMDMFSLTCKGNQAMFSVGPLSRIIRSRGTQPRRNFGQTFYPEQLHTVNLTVREGGGVEPFAQLLQPLSRENGVSIIIHSL